MSVVLRRMFDVALIGAIGMSLYTVANSPMAGAPLDANAETVVPVEGEIAPPPAPLPVDPAVDAPPTSIDTAVNDFVTGTFDTVESVVEGILG